MSRLPQHLQATLDILHAHATDGECRMSQSELARLRTLSRCTLQRHIAALENLGYLTVHRRPGQVSSYRLTAGGQGFSRIMRRLRRLLPGTGEPQKASVPPRPRFAKTVGRQDILTALQQNAAKRRHTLLVGPLGIGKSHLLRHLVRVHRSTGAGERGSGGAEESSTPTSQHPGTPAQDAPQHPGTPAPQHIYLEHVSPIKPALLSLAEMLHQDGALDVEGIEAHYMEWEDVRKKIAPLRVNQLAGLVTQGMKERNYVLVLDHLERVTPTMLPHLDALMGVAIVIGAADELKASAQRLWWAFEQVEVPPLTRDQARELLWQVADRDRVAQPQLFETRVLQQAGGNPLALITMAGKARAADLSAQEIRGLHHGAGIRYIPLTPALMLIGALIVAARFVALGLNDRDLYVLAGLGYASFFFLRYFIYRID